MDGAGWLAGWLAYPRPHTPDITAEFENVSIIKLPLYSPELNAIEQAWSWMRQHCLANRVFKIYEDIVSSVCEAENTFTERAKRVTQTRPSK
ncbi:hypothetical protein CBP31_11155 [Oceanisphaera profunda]|uniref:Tc1-like transposase DDE domain-containing protein n=2 Tax=Oceanisphaera profunda TaxID=1416627 RepID=A0A1Y0D725_9GAMM|nr:hypothetical protein CBP31_11155 [Oceanisphaera profunda]